MLKITRNEIKNKRFRMRKDIEEVTLEDVMIIPDRCFRGCVNLRKVILTGTVRGIGKAAFRGCEALEEVLLADSQSHYIVVEEEAFKDCRNLTSFNFFDRIVYLGKYAFAHCTSLTDIDLGTELRKMFINSFDGCNISEMKVNDNEKYYIKDKFLIEKIKTWDKSKWTALLYLGNENEVVFPEEITHISDCCFKDKSVQKISISPDLQVLDDINFAKERIPDNIETYTRGFNEEEYAPSDVSSFYHDPFGDCRVLSAFCVPEENPNFTEHEGVLYSKDMRILCRVPLAKEGCYEVAEGTVEIARYAFSGCEQISEIIIPDTVENFGYAVFKNCRFTKMIIADGNPNIINKGGLIYEIDDTRKALIGCERDVEEISVDEDTTDIMSYAFAYCFNAKKVDLSKLSRLDYVGDHAFSGFLSLEEVIFPDSLTIHEPLLFENCASLRKVRFSSENIVLGERLFAGCSQDIKLYIDSTYIESDKKVFEDSTSDISFEFGPSVEFFSKEALLEQLSFARTPIDPDMVESLKFLH